MWRAPLAGHAPAKVDTLVADPYEIAGMYLTVSATRALQNQPQ
jgi:hypothetical protein